MKSALLVSVLLSTSAPSTTVKWSSVEDWDIFRNVVNHTCVAMTSYPSHGYTLGILFNAGNVTAHLVIDGVAIEEDEVRRVRLRTQGQKWDSEFIGREDGMAVMNELTVEFIRALKTSTFLEVEGLGRFSLDNSAAAMAEAWSCTSSRPAQIRTF